METIWNHYFRIFQVFLYIQYTCIYIYIYCIILFFAWHRQVLGRFIPAPCMAKKQGCRWVSQDQWNNPSCLQYFPLLPTVVNVGGFFLGYNTKYVQQGRVVSTQRMNLSPVEVTCQSEGTLGACASTPTANLTILLYMQLDSAKSASTKSVRLRTFHFFDHTHSEHTSARDLP